MGHLITWCVLQREPWEQQGVHSGSDATLAPLSYRLDHKAVVIYAQPSTSQVTWPALRSRPRATLCRFVAQPSWRHPSCCTLMGLLHFATTSCLPCPNMTASWKMDVSCRLMRARPSSLPCSAPVLPRKRGPLAKRLRQHGHPAQVC